MRKSADILKENERLRVRLHHLEDVVRSFRAGDVDALVDQRAAVEDNRLCNEMLAQVADAVIAVDKTDRIIYLNAAAERLYGLAASDALGRPHSDVFSKPWIQRDEETAEAAGLHEHGEWCGYDIHVGHDGRELGVECRIKPLKDKNGLPNGRVAVIRDMSKCMLHEHDIRSEAARTGPAKSPLPRADTEHNRAETTLRESESLQAFLLKLSDALRAEPSAEAMMDLALRMLFERLRLDRCFLGIYRLTEDIGEVLYQVHDDRLLPVPAHLRLSDFPMALQVLFDRTLVIEDVMNMEGLSDIERGNLAGLGVGASINATLRKGENTPLWAIVAVSTSPRVWTPGEVSLVEEVAERTWAAVDRARAKDQLQIAHDTFRSLVDQSPFGTYIVDADFRLVQMSNGGQKAFGTTRPLIGRDFAEVVHAVWPDPFASEVIAQFRHTLATGEPFQAETEECRSDIEATEAYDWKIERIVLPDGRPGVVCHFYDFTEKQQQKEHIKLLMGELNHRSKNMLGLIQAIARQTVKTQPEHFLEIFGERLQALSASQDLLVKSEWKTVDLGELVKSQIAHLGHEHDGQIKIDGPLVQIGASASQSIGMALHELATNAAKFGALSNEFGRVVISWSLQTDAKGQEKFTMSWIESGGPPVVKPVRRGFGSTVINRMLKMSLGCETEVEVDFAPTGLVWRIGCLAARLIGSDAAPAP